MSTCCSPLRFLSAEKKADVANEEKNESVPESRENKNLQQLFFHSLWFSIKLVILQ